MPGKKQFKEQADEGFLRAAWDLAADMELGAGADVTVSLSRTARKGVWEIVVVSTPVNAVWSIGGAQVYRREFPRSEVATLAAAVFQAMHQADMLVASAIESDQWLRQGELWKD